MFMTMDSDIETDDNGDFSQDLTSSPAKSGHTPNSGPSRVKHDSRISSSFGSLSNDQSDLQTLIPSIQPDLSLSPSGVLKYFQPSPNNNQPDPQLLKTSKVNDRPDSQPESNGTQLCPSPTEVIYRPDPQLPSISAKRTSDIPDHEQASAFAQSPSLSLEAQSCSHPDLQLASSSSQLCPSATRTSDIPEHEQASGFAQLPFLSLEAQSSTHPDLQLASSSSQLCPSATQASDPPDPQAASTLTQLYPSTTQAICQPQLASASTQPDVSTDEHNITNVKKQQPKGESEWKQNTRKRRREMGSEYVSCTGKIMPAKTLKDPCSCKSKDTKCSEFSLDVRNEIFLQVWSLTWNEKRNYIYGLVDQTGVKRRRTKGIPSRNVTFQYSLKKNGQKLPVCRTMFLGTTGLTKYFVHSCFDSKKEDTTTDNLSLTEQGSSEQEIAQVKNTTSHGISKQKSRPCNPHYERGNEAHDFLQKIFDDLPKLPSHYCRKSSAKMYLERRYRSLAELHKHYQHHCQSNNKNSFQIRAFSKEFHKRNLSIYVPKKDRCDLCVGYETGNVSQDEWQDHRNFLQQALEHKDNDKQRALQSKANDDGQFAAFCMDLESVLLAPDTNASAMYFKTKLCVHNFTIYDLATADVTCYVWNETEGGLSANEFATCIIDYLKGRNVTKEVVIYSDGCTYQNRNQILANAIQYFVETSKIKVHQKYLVKGHTHVEVDSSHSLIERALKGVSINVPHDYINVIKSARKNPRPFTVRYLHHDFFKDFSKCGPYTSIRPGRKSGDPVVTDIHSLLYTPATEDGQKHVIQYKMYFNDEYQDLPHPPRDLRKHVFKEPGALHQERLKIPASKYKHLQELKRVIDKDCHAFYDSLPHQ